MSSLFKMVLKKGLAKRLLCLMLITGLVLACFAGCGGSDTPDQEPRQPADSNGDGVEPQADYKTLQVYAAYGNTENILQAFTEATGIKAEYVDMSSGEVLSRMRAERGRALGDVWFGGGVDSFMVAAEEGLLEAYKSPEADYISDRFKDPEGYWTGVSIVLVTLVVNKELSEEKGIPVPATIEDLLDPRFQGEILMPNPGISGTAFTFLASILQRMGAEKGWEYFGELDKNMPYYAERGNEPPQKASLGEIMVGVSPDGINAKREGYPVEIVYPADGTPWWHSPVAIIQGTDNLAAAQKFVDWTLSAEGQAVLAHESPRPSTRPNVELPDDVPALEDLNLVEYDFQEAAEKRDEIVEEWNQRFGN